MKAADDSELRCHAFARAATEQSALLLGKVGPRVGNAPVVPHHEITEFPDVLEDEFAPLASWLRSVIV
jgi:hypothetical protein